MKKLISFITALTFVISLTACNTKTDEIQSQISELQSQVSNLQEESSELILEEDIPDVNLRALADKIVAECPPPDGVELVYDTENINEAFNNFSNYDKNDKKFMRRYNIDTDKIIDYIRVYNSTPETGLYYFVIAKIENNSDIKAYQISANASTKFFITPYIAVKNEHPSNNINNYIYNIVLSNISDDSMNTKADKIIMNALS